MGRLENSTVGGACGDVSDQQPEPFTLVTVTTTMARHGVRYVLVGGVSGMLHGMTEYRTKDIDLLIMDEAANRERLALAMNELRAHPLRSSDQRRITGDDFTVGSTQWSTDAGDVDILISATGPNETFVVYADIERAEEYIELVDGQRVPVASLADLIRMKEAADRHKDHLALPELRRLRGDADPRQSTGYDPFGTFDIEDGAD